LSHLDCWDSFKGVDVLGGFEVFTEVCVVSLHETAEIVLVLYVVVVGYYAGFCPAALRELFGNE